MSAGGSHAGAPMSWVAVTVTFVGFLIAGFGLPMENWFLFWGGVVVAIVGGVFGLITRIMADVVVAVPPKL